jgi:hypothetical protein
MVKVMGGIVNGLPGNPVDALVRLHGREKPTMIFKTCLVTLVGLSLAAIGTARRGGQEKMPIEALIVELASKDGSKRVAATLEIFRRGKAVLPDLKKAGAKQIAPFGTIGSRRLDVVFSLIEGLPPNPPGNRGGYRSGGFGLVFEKGTSKEDVMHLGKKHGFSLSGTFRADGVPNCYVNLDHGKSLADVLRQVLTTEPKVVSVNLNYFET